MGVFDKFLDIMKLNDDDDYDDDFAYDDDFEDLDEKPKRNFFKREKTPIDDEDDFELPSEKKSLKAGAGSKITPMRQPAARRNVNANMEVCVVKPSSVEDSREITETLLDGRTVILNLEGLDLEIAQRIIDFTSGATFAISGNLQKISNYIFLVTPTNVDISGDLQDLLGNNMDMPSVRNRY
ncbi:cell division protein SepF [Ruminococcus sp. AF14-10]|nr:cell division protein SepF [Ruminococcus sp. AF14-10]